MNTLQEANVTIYSDEDCFEQWGDDFHSDVMICAGNENSDEQMDDYVADGCIGDSVSPF